MDGEITGENNTYRSFYADNKIPRMPSSPVHLAQTPNVHLKAKARSAKLKSGFILR